MRTDSSWRMVRAAQLAICLCRVMMRVRLGLSLTISMGVTGDPAQVTGLYLDDLGLQRFVAEFVDELETHGARPAGEVPCCSWPYSLPSWRFP